MLKAHEAYEKLEKLMRGKKLVKRKPRLNKRPPPPVTPVHNSG
jgi:hypothetical protein